MSILTTLKDATGALKSIFLDPDNITSDDESSLASLSKEDKEKLSVEDMKALYDSSKKVDNNAASCGKPSEGELDEFRKEARRFSKEKSKVKDENLEKNAEKDKKLEDKEQKER